MGLIPRIFRPSVIIRRKAIFQGFLGNSGFWKVVGVVVFGKTTIKKFFGRNVEVVDTSALASGRVMEVATARPMTRKHRKELRARGLEPVTVKEHREMSKVWAERRAAERAGRSRRERKRARKSEQRAATAEERAADSAEPVT
jgi:hypothetical protein